MGFCTDGILSVQPDSNEGPLPPIKLHIRDSPLGQ